MRNAGQGEAMNKQAKDYIIFPLDVPSVSEAEKYIDLLGEDVGMFKVGLELFISAGPEIVRRVHAGGSAGVFLDLKLHDIPATVSRAMEIIAGLKVKFVTVHCGETPGMLAAAVTGSQNKVGVLAVTVLTSVSGENLDAAGFRKEYYSDLSSLVLKRTIMARESGCAGIICSGHEVEMVKQNLGDDFIVVTPGIRPAWNAQGRDDQKRITTPAQAVKNGADYLVIGRPIRDAKSPREAARRIAEEIEAVL
jgi:orotidine-5'-phosphate decarboxylase